MHELSAILAIAHRDFVKLIRDRPRIIADLAFPLIFIAILGHEPAGRLRVPKAASTC